MKKIWFLILAVVLCLSLCACGTTKSFNKYVGEYTYEESSGWKETLTIRANGTGTWVQRDRYGQQRQFDVKWSSDDRYITLNCTHKENGDSFSQTFESKGSQLFQVTDSEYTYDDVIFTKVS